VHDYGHQIGAFDPKNEGIFFDLEWTKEAKSKLCLLELNWIAAILSDFVFRLYGDLLSLACPRESKQRE
jgi:phage I-like protein